MKPPTWIAKRWHSFVLGPELRAFLDTSRREMRGHSKRNPKDAELNRLQQAGWALWERSANTERRRELVIALGKLAIRLDDHEGLVRLLERAVADRVPLGGDPVNMLVSAIRRVTGPSTLVTRLDAICAAVLSGSTRLSPEVRAALANRGLSPAERLATLRRIEPAQRTPDDWEALVSLLLTQAEAADGLDEVAEAIAALDAAWPVLSAGESGRWLLAWLSIVATAKSAFATCRALPQAPITKAAAQVTRLGDDLLDPLRLFERFATGTGRHAHAWTVMSVDLLWHVDFATAPLLRRAVMDAVLEGVATGALGQDNPEAIGLGVYRCIHQCDDLWGDTPRRDDLLARAGRAIDLLAEPRRTLIRGMMHLAADDEATAEALFATRRGPAFDPYFNGHGHVSFIPGSRAAAWLDQPPSDPRLLPDACGFRIDKQVAHDPAGLTAITCADPFYANRHGPAYVRALFAKDRRSGVHLHLLGRPDALSPALRETIAAHPRLSLSSEEPPIRMPYYYATARFLRLALLQETIGTTLLMTDIDEIFRVSPDRLHQRWREHGDVGLRVYDRIRTYPRSGMIGMKAPRMETWQSIGAACLYLGPTDEARRYAELLSQLAHQALAAVRDNANSNWWIDQNVLYASLRPAAARIERLRLFSLFDAGLPFGAYASDIPGLPPPRGHRPGIPDIPVVTRDDFHADPA